MTIDLPVPPLYNHCIRHAAFGAYPTAKYSAWLEIANGIIRGAMDSSGTPTDAEKHFHVQIELWLGTGRRGDADGYVKPILDALGGACPDAKGKIVRTGLVYADDRQVVSFSCRIAAVKMPEDHCTATVEVSPARPPSDYVEEMKVARRRVREIERFEKAAKRK